MYIELNKRFTSYRNALPEMSQQRRQEQSKAIVASIVERHNYKRSETNKPRPGTILSTPRLSHFTDNLSPRNLFSICFSKWLFNSTLDIEPSTLDPRPSTKRFGESIFLSRVEGRGFLVEGRGQQFFSNSFFIKIKMCCCCFFFIIIKLVRGHSNSLKSKEPVKVDRSCLKKIIIGLSEQARANSRKHNTITMSQQMFYY